MIIFCVDGARTLLDGAPTKLRDHSMQFYDLVATLLDGSKANRQTQRSRHCRSRQAGTRYNASEKVSPSLLTQAHACDARGNGWCKSTCS